MNETTIRPADVIKSLRDHRLRWIVPAVAIALVSLGYALVRPATWEASQALVLRDEVAGNEDGLGRFSDADQMKAAQETATEIIRAQPVIAGALKRVGPPSGYRNPEHWPTLDDIESFRKKIEITAPNGAEFGKTEVIYLQVSAHKQDRAVALATALCDEAEVRMQQLRSDKAASLVAELAKTAELVRDDLEAATDRLSTMEEGLGTDLSELRILNESSSGESNLRRTMIEVQNEIRQAYNHGDELRQLRSLLLDAREDAGRLVATPNELLVSQPALRRLKDGLVDTQLRKAQLLGSMSKRHPQVLAAAAAETEIREHLHGELETALRGLDVALRVTDRRMETLTTRCTEIETRLTRLAGVRAEYDNLTRDTRNRAEILTQVERDLADARGSQAAAGSTSLLTRIDEPVTGAHPAGPRRSMVFLFGIFGGLTTGFGVVLLTTSPSRNPQPAVVAVDGKAASARPATPEFGLSLKGALKRLAGAGYSWN